MGNSYGYGNGNPSQKEVRELRKKLKELEQVEEKHRKLINQLKTQLEHYEYMLNRIRNYAILMLDPQGYIISCNNEVENLQGYRKDELIGKHFSLFYTDVDVDRGKPQKELQMALQKAVIEDEGWRIKKDGSRFWAKVVLSTVRDKDGYLIGFVKVVQDLTRRKKLEEELRDAKERFEGILNSVNDMIFVLDKEGKFVFYHSPENMRLYLPPEKFMNKSYSEVLPPYLVEQTKIAIEDNLEGKIAEFEYSLLFNREERWFYTVMSPMMRNGEYVGSVAVIRDITGLKQNEQKLKRLVRILEVLSQVNGVLVRSKEEKKLYERVCEIIVETGGYRAVAIRYLLGRNILRVISSKGCGEDPRGTADFYIDKKQSHPFIYALRQGKPVILRNIQESKEFPTIRQEAKRLGYKSMGVFPLIMENTVRGIISIYSDESFIFTDEEVEVLTEVAEDLSFGILHLKRERERKKRVNEERKRQRKIVRYQEALLELREAEDLDFENFVKKMTEIDAKTLKVERVGVWFLEEERGDLVLKDMYLLKENKHESGMKLDILKFKRYFKSLKNNRAFIVNDALKDPRVSELLDEYIVPLDIRSMLEIPIKIGGKLVGVICYEKVGRRKRWDTQDIEFSLSMGELVAKAIERSKRRQAEREVKKLAEALENAPGLIYITDKTNRIEYANKTVEKILGFKKEEFTGKMPFEILIPAAEWLDKAFSRKMWRKVNAGKTVSQLFAIKNKNGEILYFDFTITPVRDAHGKILHFIYLGKDVTKERKIVEKLEYLSNYDLLTGLPNKNKFQKDLSMELKKGVKKTKLTAVLVLDIDEFRSINGTYGAERGDVVLKEVAKRLKDISRKALIARLGNDEFGIAFRCLQSHADLLEILEHIFDILSYPVKINQEELIITVSLGISVYPHDGKTAEDLIRKAYMSLKKAKKVSGNSYEFFNKEMAEKAEYTFALKNDIMKAISDKEFILYFQPYYELESGKLAGMEVLLRWQHKERGIINPGEFIPILEETGMIVTVGEWILEKVREQMIEWRDKGYPLYPLSVNISPVQFRDKKLLEKISKVIEDHGIDASYLILEITETTFMEDVNYTSRVLKKLKEMGVRISIDDFGTGYSSLAYLKRFPVDTLKIDISFIKNIEKDPDDATIVSTIIQVAHNMDIKAVAEGVERKQQWDILRLLRCDIAQGFYKSRPLPAEEMEKILIEEGARQ